MALFAAARSLQPRWPWLGFVAAFAEAATIGGIADWYAVVALFKRPLGLPIPHTAIIPANQNRIADNLGHFIEVNFLAPEPVRDKLKRGRLRRARRRLAVRCRDGPPVCRASSAGWCRRRVSAIEQSGLRDFITRACSTSSARCASRRSPPNCSPPFTDDRRHQKLFDELIGVLGKFLNDEAALAAMRDKIRDELPSLFNLFRADAYLLKKIVASAGALFDEVLADQNHPLRHEFDRFVIGFIEQLRNSPEYAKRAEKLKRDLLARPELRAARRRHVGKACAASSSRTRCRRIR